MPSATCCRSKIERNGLKNKEINVTDDAITGIIRYYTREAGVRNLEREISRLCRKAVKKIVLDKRIKHVEITGDNLSDFLGVQRFDFGKAEENNQVGQVTGLAWTEVGGDLLTIEATNVAGKGKNYFNRFFGRCDARVDSNSSYRRTEPCK